MSLSATSYAFDNDDAAATDRHNYLPAMLDGNLLLIANVAQMRDGFLADGWDDERLARLAELARDPRMVVRAQFMYSVIGRRPAGNAL